MADKYMVGNSALFAAANIQTHVVFNESMINTTDPLAPMALPTKSSGGSDRYVFTDGVPEMETQVGDVVLKGLIGKEFYLGNEQFSTGISLHENDVKDDNLSLWNGHVKELAEKAKRFKGRRTARMLLNGFDGSAYPELGSGLGHDGAFFFSNAHASFGGPSMSNLLTAAPLSFANLAAAERKLASMKTFDGSESLEIRGTHLFVGPNMVDTAISMIKSQFIIGSGGTATKDNIVYKGRYEIVEVPQIDIGSAWENYWFLACMNKASKPMIWQEREPVTQHSQISDESNDKFKRGMLNFKVQARAGIGYFDHRLIVGATAPPGIPSQP